MVRGFRISLEEVKNTSLFGCCASHRDKDEPGGGCLFRTPRAAPGGGGEGEDDQTLEGEAQWPKLLDILEFEVERLFTELDVDGDQMLNADELEASMEKLRNRGVCVTLTLERLDLNHDGGVNLVEFKRALTAGYKTRLRTVRALLESSPAFRDTLSKVFARVDANHNGFVEEDEFSSLVREITREVPHARLTNADVKNEFQKFDKDNDGKLSREECELLLQNMFVNLAIVGAERKPTN